MVPRSRASAHHPGQQDEHGMWACGGLSGLQVRAAGQQVLAALSGPLEPTQDFCFTRVTRFLKVAFF